MTDPADLRRKVRAYVETDCRQLARVRGESYLSLLKGHAQQCRENLHDSIGTTEEGYWRLCLSVVEEMVAAEIGMVEAR